MIPSCSLRAERPSEHRRQETDRVTYLTTAELAIRWGMNKGSLANARVNDQIDHPGYVRLNGRVLYPEHEVERFEAERFVPARMAA